MPDHSSSWSSSADADCYLPPDPDAQGNESFKIKLEHEITWGVAGGCAFIACIMSFVLIYKHLVNYHAPAQQKLIIRILLMVPIYAIDSFLSFRFVWLAVFFDIGRDCYEAFVIYNFFTLLTEYIGGYHHGKEIFESKEPFNLIFPLFCIRVKPKRGLIRTCKRCTLQYVIIRPLMSALAVVLQATHRYCSGSYSPRHGYVYMTIVLFFSVTIAMYALVMFYVCAKKQLERYNPVPKFASIKLVIFLSFWQSVLISGLVYIKVIRATAHWSTQNVAEGIQDALLCFEMLLASIFHFFVFDTAPYAGGERTNVWSSFADAFNPKDIAVDLYHSFRKKKKNKNLPLDHPVNRKTPQSAELKEYPPSKSPSPYL